MEPTSRDLIVTFERGQRRLAVTTLTFVLIVLIALAVLVVTQQAANRRLQDEVLRRTGQTNAYIRCVGLFFAQDNRADLTLKDFDKCAIERDGSSIPGTDQNPDGSHAPESDTLFTAPPQQAQPIQQATPAPPPDSDPEPVPIDEGLLGDSIPILGPLL